MKLERLHLLFTLLLAALGLMGLASCSPARAVSTPAAEILLTQAYQTIETRLTQGVIQTPEPTPEPSPSTTPSFTPTPLASTPTLLLPSATPSPSPEESCDRAAPGFPRIDIEIDDDAEMEPGQRFTKIWRLVNSGDCTWTSEYKAVWFFGARLGETLAVPLRTQVAPGESVDITVDMVAPQTPGTYQSNWKLQNIEGTTFGIGPAGNSPFWVRIVVVQPPTPTSSPTTPPPPTETPTLTPTMTDTPTPTPVVVVRSETILRVGDSIDLITGMVNPAENPDIFHQEDASFTRWLSPSGSALLGIYGFGEPSYQACYFANMSVAPVAVGSLSPGAYLCYRTQEGLTGWVRLNSVNAENNEITVTFQTWENTPPH